MCKNTNETFTNSIINWYKNNGRDFPWRNTSNPYYILISEMLLQRTRAEQVKPIYLKLITRYPNVIELSMAKPEEIKEVISSLGLHKRAHYLSTVSSEIIDKFNSSIPRNKKSLLELKGVGDYTANAILAFAFDLPYPIIDSNVVRILNRFFNLGHSRRKPNKEINKIATNLISDKNIKPYNYGLLDLGAKICKPSTPKCKNCPLINECEYK